MAHVDLAKTVRKLPNVTTGHGCLWTDMINLVERKCQAYELAAELDQPDFTMLIRQFLQGQLHPDLDRESLISANSLPDILPNFRERISVYNSASAMFYAPSDLSGVGGMRREHIRAVPSWRKGP